MRKIIFLSLAAALLIVGCSKNISCKCVTSDDGETETTTIKVQRPNQCTSITQLGFEKQKGDTNLVRTMRAVSCEEVEE